MATFPVLLSIPHGGIEIPPELANRIILSPYDLFNDGDAFTKDIYDLRPHVSEVISTEIARAFIDLNRASDDLPPGNSDGVVKSHTSYGKVIYRNGLEPDEALIKKLIERYYLPYHQKIQDLLNGKIFQIELALDCHSMAAVGPSISPDRGEKRPMICLGNAHGQSCPKNTIEKMAECFTRAFSLKDNEISINRPFAGGYITRTYGGNPIPWIQVELNRELYLREPFFELSTLSLNIDRIYKLQYMFEDVLRLFFAV